MPRYSGVRPIISPAMNTARMAKISIPYRPEPTPPNTTSPSWIITIGTMPPSGVNESCMAFTAPQEAAVVITANRLVALMPKRVSLPSILPPACRLFTLWSTPSGVSSGLPPCSAGVMTNTAITNITVIAARIAMPWRRSPTMRPKVKHSAAGIRKMDSICTKLASGVGFSYGWAEFALKKPPPLVPSILIASCDATGPMARVCVAVFMSSSTGLPLSSFSGWPSAPSLGCW